MQEITIRPMPAATLERVLVPGRVGAIETDVNDPGERRRGVAVVAHPHPLQGGTKDNKVVTTLAKALFTLGYVVARPNFRGVGGTEGAHDEGRGEAEDIIAVIEHLRERYMRRPLVLAGFSFGSFVQTHVAKRVAPERMILVGPAVNRFPTESVPADALVIHGEEDDVVPLSAVLEWARPHALPIVVVPGTGHFFHGRLNTLAQIVMRNFDSLDATASE